MWEKLSRVGELFARTTNWTDVKIISLHKRSLTTFINLVCHFPKSVATCLNTYFSEFVFKSQFCMYKSKLMRNIPKLKLVTYLPVEIRIRTFMKFVSSQLNARANIVVGVTDDFWGVKTKMPSKLNEISWQTFDPHPFLIKTKFCTIFCFNDEIYDRKNKQLSTI